MRWDGFLAQGRLRSETPISQAPESRSAQEVRGAAAGGRDTEKYLGSSMHSGDWARDPACFLPRSKGADSFWVTSHQRYS